MLLFPVGKKKKQKNVYSGNGFSTVPTHLRPIYSLFAGCLNSNLRTDEISPLSCGFFFFFFLKLKTKGYIGIRAKYTYASNACTILCKLHCKFHLCWNLPLMDTPFQCTYISFCRF